MARGRPRRVPLVVKMAPALTHENHDGCFLAVSGLGEPSDRPIATPGTCGTTWWWRRASSQPVEARPRGGGAGGPRGEEENPSFPTNRSHVGSSPIALACA